VNIKLYLNCLIAFVLLAPELSFSETWDPYNVTVVAGNKKATVSWEETGLVFLQKPYPISGFVATASTGQKCRASGKSRSCVISGLKNGVPVTFSVVALWAGKGAGDSSPSSQVVIPFTSDIDAVCGSASNTYQATQPNFNDLCLVGSLAFGTMGSDGLFHGGLTQAVDGTWSWQCIGYRQGLTQSCKTIHNPNTFYISGKGPAGGTVFYVTSDGLHGMEFGAPLTTYLWGCNGKFLGVTDTAIGSGSSNTTKILTMCADANTAAAIAHAYTLNGFSDWYLPSQDEMLAASKLLKGSDYWTSSETGPNQVVSIALGGAMSVYKTAGYYGKVYPVRSF
jgi:hypothetical protein